MNCHLQAEPSQDCAKWAFDWPGFGGLPPRGRTDLEPAGLEDLLRECADPPSAVIAAGAWRRLPPESSGKILGLAGKLCLLSPTWHGPLPIMLE